MAKNESIRNLVSKSRYNGKGGLGTKTAHGITVAGNVKKGVAQAGETQFPEGLGKSELHLPAKAMAGLGNLISGKIKKTDYESNLRREAPGYYGNPSVGKNRKRSLVGEGESKLY